MYDMNSRHRSTLDDIFTRPVKSDVRWSAIEAMLEALGATITERAGSRVAIDLNGQLAVFHRPHPKPDTDKGAVNSMRKFLELAGVTPEMFDEE